MKLDYTTSKGIAQRFYIESFNYWRGAGMGAYKAIAKAEQETYELKVNPYRAGQELDSKACKDYIKELSA